jgi:hydroxypyruvate reductase
MAAQAARLLGDRLRGGMVIGLPPLEIEPPLEGVAGGHPVPTDASADAGARALALAAVLDERDTLIVLLSGGTSALMAQPAPGVTLEDKQSTTGILLRNSADIGSLNAVRKHLSAIKGGCLATATRAACWTLAISDVVGDDLSVIGSGPTVADPTTFTDALDVLTSHGGREVFNPRVVARLERGARGEFAETPKPGDARLARSEAFVVGGRADAMRGVAEEAVRRGYRVIVVDEAVTGEARDAAREYLERVRSLVAVAARPLCIISSGETTVTVRGTGKGGRNQEFALAAATGLPSLGAAVACASVGTDGVDGPTRAAGAIADDSTMRRAARAGLPSIDHYLRQNDAGSFFEALGDLVITGPTGTNAGDLQVLLIQ